MKKIILFCITIYQLFFSKLLNQMLGISSKCRHELSCSGFAKRAIKKYGIFIGGYRSIIRILSCQPFMKLRVES